MWFRGSDVEAHLADMRKKAADALPGSSWSPFVTNPNLPPDRADIVIVGGGVMGWSIAYWLKRKEMMRGGVRVLVVEKDPTVRGQETGSDHVRVLPATRANLHINCSPDCLQYSQASTVLSAGGIRQQFSLLENIHLSLVSADFMRNINVGHRK